MDLRRLRYFQAVACQLHFGRAAEALHIAQPALSQQIRALERELGVELLDRDRRHVRLTPAGRALLEEANELLARADRAVEKTRLAARGLAGQLRVSYTRSSPGGPAADLIAAYRDRYPDVAVELMVGYHRRHVEQLLDGELDAAFVRPPLTEERIAIRTVAHEPLMVALPGTHPLARRRAIRPEQLHDEPVVSWPRGNGPGLYDTIQLKVWGAHPVRIVAEEPDEEHMLHAVAAGAGVAVCIAGKLSTLRIPGLTVRRFAAPPPTVPLALAWRPDHLSEPLRHLLDLAAERCPPEEESTA
ncbi:MAG: LysR substrate-binding domain-containing protein [Mycobacteriales bacterium]